LDCEKEKMKKIQPKVGLSSRKNISWKNNKSIFSKIEAWIFLFKRDKVYHFLTLKSNFKDKKY